MPPPPSPLAHRRTNSPSCHLRKMSLSKAETFHHPSSTPGEDDPVLSVAHLSKRSTTYTRSSFASWLYNNREAASDVIADFEQTFSGARGPRPATRRRSARDLEDALLTKANHRASSPVDSGIGSSIGSPSEKNLSRTLAKALDLTSNKDSALGDSVSGSVVGADIVQGWLHRCLLMCSSNSNPSFAATNSNKVSTTTRSTSSRTSGQSLTIIRYPIPTYKKNSQPLLSGFARRQIYKRLFAPLLTEDRFEEFRPIVAGTRKNKNLRCLRDIEQSLINQPVVSTIFPVKPSRSNKPSKTLTVTAAEYRAFGELTVQLVIDTFQHLSESEQRRSTDRAYDNGYFLDLVQQVQQLAAHIGSSNTTVEDGSAPSLEDEITLEGGIGETGDFAELVRWKNGEGISLRTGLPYIPMPANLKRGASGQLAEDAERSARRKKGYIPEIVNLPCSQKDCDKVFHRKCDLSKHEKTHTRPYKCPIAGCKYFDLGLPTEKELDRHMNDKHEDTPALYTCDYDGCGFKSKRESNLKQHKEKKHGWTYIRQKGTHKGSAMTPAQSASTPSAGYSSVQPSPAPMPMNTNWDGSNASGSVHQSPFEQPYEDFEYTQPYSHPLFPRNQAPRNMFDFNAPVQVNTNYKGGNDGINTAPWPTPQSGVLHNFHSPTTPAYSNITGSPMIAENQYGQSYQSFNPMPTPDSRRLSYNQVVPTPNYGMVDPMAQDISFGEDDVPQQDFALFGGGNDGVFTHAGAGDATLFQNDNFHTNFTPDQFDLPDMDMNQFNDMGSVNEFPGMEDLIDFN